MNIMPQSTPCSGCGACTAICPKDAIKLDMNSAGFYAAVVDEEKCIHCGLCEQICSHTGKKQAVDLYSVPPMALQSIEQATVFRSASGGIAHELAAAALEKGWKVVGAVYDCEQDQVVHRIVIDAEELPKLSGSKYLQSNTEEAFRQIVADVASKKYIVFGTPCQIRGLSTVLAKKGLRSQAVLVEIFCHGVPSYKLWQEQVSQARKKLGQQPFRAVRFRDKTYGWHNYRLHFENINGVYEAKREHALFWQVYFEDVLLNDACYQCTARLNETSADIRIGDYWGSHFQARTDGVSLVFPATENGRQAIQELIELGQVQALPSTNSQEALKYQTMACYQETALHHEAMEALRQGCPLKSVVKGYRRKLPIRKKVKRYMLIVSGWMPQGLVRKIRELKVK